MSCVLLAESVQEILGSPAHWIAEVVIDIALGSVLYPVGRHILRRHDRKAHNKQ